MSSMIDEYKITVTKLKSVIEDQKAEINSLKIAKVASVNTSPSISPAKLS